MGRLSLLVLLGVSVGAAACVGGDDTLDVSASGSSATEGSASATGKSTSAGSLSATATETVGTTASTTDGTTTATTDGTSTTTSTSTTTTSTTSTTTSTTTTSTTTSDSSTTESMPAALQLLALEVADFSGDGELDILVLGIDEDALPTGRLRHGLGDGSFAGPSDTIFDATSVYPVVGDADDDGIVDVALPPAANKIQFFRGGADDVFAPWKTVTLDSGARSSVLFDLDGDGDADLTNLWGNGTTFGLRIFPSVGGMSFPTGPKSVVGNAGLIGFDPKGLLLGDLDGDGYADAVLYEPTVASSIVRVFGTDAAIFVKPVIVEGGPVWTAELGDIDNDGDLDLIAIEHAPANIAVYLNDGAGTLIPGPITAVDALTPYEMCVGDINVDGDLDVVIVDDGSPQVLVAHGAGDGTFPSAQAIDLPSPAIRVHAGLLDDNLNPDLVVATFAAGDVTVILDP